MTRRLLLGYLGVTLFVLLSLELPLGLQNQRSERHDLTAKVSHDAMVLAAYMPAAMLFIRTPGGISHHPDESVNEGDVAFALATGMNFLNELAASISV